MVSKAKGKTADIDRGDKSKNRGNLRYVQALSVNGHRLAGNALRPASRASRMPK